MTDQSLKEFLFNSPIGLFLMELHPESTDETDFLVSAHNDAFPELLNEPGGLFKGKKITEILRQNATQTAFWLEKVRECRSTNRVIGFQQYSPIFQKWYQVYLQKMNDHEMAGQVLDISIAKKSEERLNSLVRGFEDIVLEMDGNLRFIDVLATGDHLFFDRDFFLGKHISEVFQGDFLGKFLDAFAASRRTGDAQVVGYASPYSDKPGYYEARIQYRTSRAPMDERYTVSVRDVSYRVNSEKALAFHRAFEQLLVESTTLIVQSDDTNFDAKLDEVLERIGLFARVDRSYFFEMDASAGTCSNRNEWCNEGVTPEMDNLQGISMDAVPRWKEYMEEGKEIYIEDVDGLDNLWAAEKAILQPQGIRSLLVLPVMNDGYLYGFIGFDAVKEKVVWSAAARNLLQILADNLGSAIHRNKRNRQAPITAGESQ